MIWLNHYTDTVYCIIRVIRLAAFIASGEMAVGYVLTSFLGKMLNHAPSVLKRLLPILNKGELPVLFCFKCLANNVLRPGSLEY
jgi:hypothetical protein